MRTKRTYKTKHIRGHKWGPGITPLSSYVDDIPAGLRVRDGGKNGDGSTAFFVDEFPFIDENDLIRKHDARTYGIRLTSDQIE